MAHDGRAVANFVLDFCDEKKRQTTNLALQKIVTRGSFYAYFDSKSALYAESITAILSEKAIDNWDGVSIDPRAHELAAEIIGDYLSVGHFENIDGSCPLIALPNDVSRTEQSVKRAFESVLKVLIDIFEQGLERKGAAARRRALAIASLCVGGMVLARTVEDSALADELRQAAQGIALSLGLWPNGDEAHAVNHGGISAS